MTKWIAKAKNKLRRNNTEETPQPFEQQCPCGSKVLGNRDNDCQIASCPDCSRQHLVLPRNTYPQPIRQKKKKKKSKRDAGSGGVFNRARRVANRMSQSVSRNAVHVGSSTAMTSRVTAMKVRQFFTPFRTIVIAIFGVAVLTAAYGIRASILEKARVQLRESVVAAETALEEQDFLKAAEQYLAAAEALDTLDRHEPADMRIRQFARESNVLANLSPSGLLGIAEDGQKYLSRAKLDEWNTHFNAIYKDLWVVLDTTVQRVNLSNDQFNFEVAVPLWVNESAIQIGNAPTVLDELDWSAESRKRVVLAAQLTDCRLKNDEPDRWVFTVNPDTAFLWMHANTYEGLGIEFDEWYPKDDIVRVLNQQAATQQIDPENEQ